MTQIVIDTDYRAWDYPTMVVVADTKRRIVLPKPAKAGDVFECVPQGEGYVLERLRPAPRQKPPVSKRRINPSALVGIDLDEPAFPPLSDERAD
jgi:hypothetical protein